MPETLWVCCRVKEFGPLIVSIDTHGNNLFEQNKIILISVKEIVADEICQNVSFINKPDYVNCTGAMVVIRYAK